MLRNVKKDLAEQIKVVFKDHRCRYGAIRISKELQYRGIKNWTSSNSDLDENTKFNGHPAQDAAAAFCPKNNRFKP